MSGNIRQFHPPFMESLDKFLLIHAPTLWKMRFHHAVFYGTIAGVLVYIFALTVPIHPKDVFQFRRVAWLLSIGALALFIWWCVQLSHHRIERLFGRTSAAAAFWKFIGYTAVSALIFSTPAIFTQTISDRISARCDRDEILRVYDAYVRYPSPLHTPVLTENMRECTGLRIYDPQDDFDRTAATNAASSQIYAILDLIDSPTSIMVRLEDELYRSFTLFWLMTVYGSSLGMIAFLIDYVRRRVMVMALVILSGGSYLSFIVALTDTLGYSTRLTWVILSLVIFVIFLLAAWSFTHRGNSVHPWAPVSVCGFCLAVPAILQVAVLYAIDKLWLDPVARLFYATVAVILVTLFIPIAHRWLVVLLSLPER